MKIANKISLSFVITVAILTGIVAPIYYKIAKDSMEKQIFAHLSTTAHSRTHHIEIYLREHKYGIEIIGESDLIEAALTAIIHNDPDSKELIENVNLQLNELVAKDEEIYEIFILNSDGKIIISRDENAIGMDKSTDAYFLEGKRGTYIKDAYYSETAKKNSMAISAPISNDKTGEFLGVLVAGFELIGLNEITTDRVGLGETGEIYLVNRYGYMITSSRFIKNSFLKQKVDTVNVRNCFSIAERQREHIGHEPVNVSLDYRGVQVLGAHEYIPEMQWALLAEIDIREALAPLARIRFLFLIIMFLLPIVAWSVGVFISRLITRPIRKLHEGTEVIGEGNLDYKVGTEAKDEVGQLSRAFDRMTESLKKTTTSIDKLNKEITERKEAQAALADYARQLKETNKELDDFTYIVSHDLKEPLRSMDAFSKFVSDDYKDKLDKQGKDYLKRIRANAGRMGDLVEDLLEISRIERRKNPFEEVQIQELVTEVKLRLEYAIKEKNVQVVIQDKLPKVFCDRVRLTEVFVNLVSNAIKFNDKSNPRIEIGSSLKDNFYQFYVKDNGPGIEEQYFDKIFEIFQRLGRREKLEGTGVGLTIVKKIIQMHKGKTWVESKIGEGTTFYFTIPKKERG